MYFLRGGSWGLQPENPNKNISETNQSKKFVYAHQY